MTLFHLTFALAFLALGVFAGWHGRAVFGCLPPQYITPAPQPIPLLRTNPAGASVEMDGELVAVRFNAENIAAVIPADNGASAAIVLKSTDPTQAEIRVVCRYHTPNCVLHILHCNGLGVRDADPS